MITQEQLNADKSAVEAATAQLAKDQAEFDAIAPHLSVLAEIEAYAKQLEVSACEAIDALVAKARALF